MNRFLLLIFAVATALAGCKTLQWADLSNEDELQVSYSWEKLKEPTEEGAEMRIHVWVQNTGTLTLEYDLGLEFFRKGVHVQNATAATACIKPGSNQKGKLSGVYFEPVGIKASEVEAGDITIELAPMNLREVDSCEK